MMYYNCQNGVCDLPDNLLLSAVNFSSFCTSYKCGFLRVLSPLQVDFDYFLGKISLAAVLKYSPNASSYESYYTPGNGGCGVLISDCPVGNYDDFYNLNKGFAAHSSDFSFSGAFNYDDIVSEAISRNLIEPPNIETEETENKLTNIIQSKLNMEDVFDSIFIITSSIILFFFMSKILMKFISFFEK